MFATFLVEGQPTGGRRVALVLALGGRVGVGRYAAARVADSGRAMAAICCWTFELWLTQTQTKSSINGSVLRVAFRSELPRPKLESLLAEAGGLLVSGPDADGAVSVRALGGSVAPNAQSELVAKLKSMKEVLSVEPISAAGPQ